MGCFWSSNEDSRYRCVQCGKREGTNLDQICEICESRGTEYLGHRTHQQLVSSLDRFCYGEYRCICGRSWSSRRSWSNSYQICERCHREVLPHNQRPLRPSDMSNDKDVDKEHKTALCQKCRQLGYYCGKASNPRRNGNPWTNTNPRINVYSRKYQRK